MVYSQSSISSLRICDWEAATGINWSLRFAPLEEGTLNLSHVCCCEVIKNCMHVSAFPSQLRVKMRQEEEREIAEEPHLQDRVIELNLSYEQVTQDTETKYFILIIT